MRLFGAATLTVVLLLSPLATPAEAFAAPAEGCRQQWSQLVHAHASAGNPGGSGATRDLQRRWDRYDQHARRLAATADASDCRRVGAFARAWAGLERLLRGMQPHDYLYRLRLANSDLARYRERTGDNPGRRVMRAFRFLREQAPRAAGDLAPVVDAAPALTTADRAQVTGYLRDYRAAARASRHAMKAKAWAQVIDRAALRKRA